MKTKKFLLVFGVVLAFVGFLVAIAFVSVPLGTTDKFFLYFFGWTKDYPIIIFVVGYLSAIGGAAIAIGAHLFMEEEKTHKA